jgi:hypothetical protein
MGILPRFAWWITTSLAAPEKALQGRWQSLWGWGYLTPENVPKGVSAAATGILERSEGQALGAARSRASGEDTGA